jgi:hypothetical protein
VLLISFIALPIRGVIAAQVMNKWGVHPVQILDGIGAGLQSARRDGWGDRPMAAALAGAR